jgi:AcrR family transcriptional regulator
MATVAHTVAIRTDPEVDTPRRILDAAFERVAAVGLSRTTVEDVARGARLSRQTVYRYFGSKDLLVTALVLREEERFLDGAREAFAREPDLASALEGAILFCLRYAREHPLLDRLLATDSETFLPYLTTRAAPVIDRATEVVRRQVTSKGWVRVDLVDATVDMLVRMMVSHAITPSPRQPEAVARELAAIATLAFTGGDIRSTPTRTERTAR